MILRADEVPRPVDVVRLLVDKGLSLRKAYEALNRLVEGEKVAIELAGDSKRIRSELSRLGIVALPIRLPTADVRRIREHFGLSQTEFAIRFGFEVDTVQNWEQRRNRPDQAMQLLLKLIEAYPDDVEAVLTEESRT